ncbi:ATP-binding protein [Streptomyces sp. NBC_01264]|uniref:ATP-binding protein n=1 Tax=Streptomyces sp. NBC_01264 TaxID=2903804 RepID=UPI00224F8B52|nr:NB-ARC domain-containing protein [Streptomyces sp. NBC_01264]MCX4780135.1 NB-ARC domain-containing protein [Streptomyces sp. NBC_01264]
MEELAALAAAAAAQFVGLAVSDGWESAKGRLAGFFGRRGGEADAAATGEAATGEAAGEAEALAEGAAGPAELAVVDGLAEGGRDAWRGGLLRVLLERPGAEAELRALLGELGGPRHAGGQPGLVVNSGAQYGLYQGAVINGGVNYHVTAPETPEVPDEIPALRTRFHNRTGELAAIDGLIPEGTDHVGVLLLGGTPGVGKTATATRWAHRSRPRFPDGQLYVDFAALRGPSGGADVSAAVGMCLRSLGVGEDYLPHSLAERTRLYRKRSQGRRMLLMLDDVSDPAQVRALMPQGAGSALVVTSSSARLTELFADGAVPLDLEPLDTASALLILADRCGERVTAAEPGAAERLVALCGGLPVALHIVAARLLATRRLTPAGLADELADESRRLTAMSLRGERTVSVSAVFDSAYLQLEPEEARLYRLLGLLPGRSFDAATAAAAAGLGVRETESLLDVLQDARLLEYGPAGQGRYHLHDLVRLHARERAAAEEGPGGHRDLVERVARHYVVRVGHADRAVRAERLRIADFDPGPEPSPFPGGADGRARALEWLEAERAGIVALLREASALGLRTPVWQLAEGFTALFLYRRHLGDWRESLELGAEAAAEDLVPAAEARLRSMLSRPLMDLGEAARARTELDKAVACAEVSGRTVLRASVMEFLGRYLDRVEPVRAIEAYERSLALNTEAGEARGAAIALFFLGCAQDAAGDPARALETLTRAREAFLAGAEPDRRMAARAAVALGRAHDRLGESARAVAVLRQAVRALAEQGATHYEAEALLALADMAERPGGDRSDLAADLARALEIHEAGGSPLAEALRERLRAALEA